MTVTGACPELIGRAPELEFLARVFETTAGGRALTVLVCGDAGIGKSRLVEEFCDRARLQGARVATGVCVPSGSGLPYAPVMGVLRGLDGQLGQSSALQLLGAAGGEDGPDRSIPVDPGKLYHAVVPVPGEFGKTVFFESILAALVELSTADPIVVVFEDLQWADSGSTQLIDFLTRNLGDSRVLIVATLRSEELDRDHPLMPWLAELGRHPRVSQLAVAGLDRADLAVLIADRTGDRPGPAVLDSVWTRSQGNPFFAEELLAAADTSELPVALQGLIVGRVRELTAASQQVLAVAAVAGSTVEHDLLAAVLGLAPDDLGAAITEALDKHIIVIDPSRTGYRFRHALLREAVVESLLPARRIRLHRAIAVALRDEPSLTGSIPSHRIAELATHWWAAGEWTAALRPALDAIDAALAVSAFPEALTFLEHALEALDRAPESAGTVGVDRLRLLEQGADLAYLAGANARAVELAQLAIDATDEHVDPTAAARCHTLLGRNLWGIGDSDAAFDAYRRAVSLLPADTPSVELARLLAEEARGYLLMSLPTKGEQCAREAVAVARTVGARNVEGHALNTMGCCRAALGFVEDGVDLIRQSLLIAEELASPDDLNRAYGNLASVFLDQGRLEDAVSVMFDSAAVGEDLWGVRLNGASGNGVEALVRLGRYAEAETVLAQLGTQALGVCAPGPWTLPSPMMIRRGRFDVAQQMVDTAREMTTRLEDVQQAAYVLALATELDLEQGRPQDALGHIERALDLTARSEDETQLPELCMRAVRALADLNDSARLHGRPVDLVELRRRGDALVDSVHRMVLAREARGAAHTPRTLAAQAQAGAERSRLDRSDPERWDDAARLWSVAREPYPQAYCRWREAEALLTGRSNRTRAAAVLDEAWQLARGLGAEPLMGHIVGLAQRGRVELGDLEATEPAPEAQVAADFGLTTREIEILAHLADGRSDRQIGEALFISKKTVSVHVSKVLRKLAVVNRIEAGKIGQLHGLSSYA